MTNILNILVIQSLLINIACAQDNRSTGKNDGTVASPFIEWSIPDLYSEPLCGSRGLIEFPPSAPRLPSGTQPDPNESPIGKVPTIPHSWPWMASIWMENPEPKKLTFLCGAVLIFNQFVLTNVECVSRKVRYVVRLGAYNFDEQEHFAEDFEVEKIDIHPHYNHTASFMYNGIAVVKLASKVVYKKGIQPICLPWDAEMLKNIIGLKVIATGWGNLFFGGPPQSVLHQVDLTVFDSSICQISYLEETGFLSQFPYGMNNENMLCVGDGNGGNNDVCQGDSGGPLVHKHDDGSYVLDGLIFGGVRCGNPKYPGLYHPIRKYETMLWIREVVFS